MNAYTKLKDHLDRHVYKRGKFKGDAPFDGSRRGRSHIRVFLRSDCMAVHMHSTTIIRAYPDGRIAINTNSWYDSSTTRATVNDALRRFASFPCGLHNERIMGVSQPVLVVRGTPYRYYDGIELDAEGKLVSEPRRFEMRRIDKDESDEFMAEMKASGFKDMFPLLYATTPAPDNYTPRCNARRMRDDLTNADRASTWGDIIAPYKYSQVWNYKSGRRELLEMGDAKSCWNAIMKDCKKEMYVTLLSDKTTL